MKMSDTEKTALNVMNLLLPVLDALVTSRRDEQDIRHEAKLNRLESGVRSNEYANDSLCQYSRKFGLQEFRSPMKRIRNYWNFIRLIRNQFLTNRKKLKETEFKDIFISEDLTKLRLKLFQYVRKLDEVKTVYTRYGRIHGSL